MEENREKIKGILDQATPRKAPIDLSERVLSQWKAEQEAQIIWKPLISKKVWFIIASSFILLTIWLMNMGPAPKSTTQVGEFLQRFSFELPTLSPSPVLLTSVLALALMVGYSVLKMNTGHKLTH